VGWQHLAGHAARLGTAQVAAVAASGGSGSPGGCGAWGQRGGGDLAPRCHSAVLSERREGVRGLVLHDAPLRPPVPPVPIAGGRGWGSQPWQRLPGIHPNFPCPLEAPALPAAPALCSARRGTRRSTNQTAQPPQEAWSDGLHTKIYLIPAM